MTKPSPQTPPIDIRTFESYEQIRTEVEGFIENHPITKLTYAQLIGDYNLPDQVQCCVQKENGNLCERRHNRGWVARLKDGSATIIGNDCGEDKFGADSSWISDRSRYINEKKRKERLETLKQLLGQKEERLARLTEVQKDIKSLESRVKVVTGPLGPFVLRRLKDMNRNGRGDVAVTAVKIRVGVDDKGNKKTERSTFVQVLGTLGGLDLAGQGTFSAVYDSINEIVRIFHRAGELVLDEDIVKRSKEVEKIAGKLQQFDRVVAESERLLSLETTFMENNFALLCFLTKNREERLKAAKVALRHSPKGEHTGRFEAWLSDYEKSIVDQLKVDSIEIQ